MKKLLFSFTLILIFFFIGSFGFLIHLIFLEPGEHLDLRRIKKSVLTESTVYYRDGQTKLGAFFSEAHRDYLVAPNQMAANISTDDSIPPLFLKAIVASEDQNFYHHIGVSPLGIIRAALTNLRARKVVQGGSTLTQQTAELLFEHKATDQWGKWKEKILETLDAFRLEAKYSKNQILEFYTNLFHVHGTGQGLAIAARYYFNKTVSELNLQEIAFIAGSVKGPANYNPFRTKDPEKIKTIIQRATVRRDYVLNNMRVMGAVSQKEFEEASKNPVAFHQGNFRFEENHQMDAVRKALEAEPWKSKLLEYGISDVNQAEINIYTTLDRELQRTGEFALKRHLSRLEFKIKNYVIPSDPPLSEKAKPRIKEFYVGKIIRVVQKPAPAVSIQVGAEQGIVEGKYAKEFVESVLRLRKKAVKSHYRKAFRRLKKGDPVLVSTHGRKPDGQWTLGIEQNPQLNGGVFILQEGEVRGMIGGFDNYGFNRALQARRQPGSTFKLPVYLAALQLGWESLEPLSNERRVYPFQGQFYFPRPDHEPKDVFTSMIWAGAKSENLASVYLLVHLLDQLTLKQFKALMRFNGFDQKPNEKTQNYRTRLRDQFGIIDTEKRLFPGIFGIVQKRLKNEFLFDSVSEEAQLWDRLFYGLGWEKAYESRKKSKKRQKISERQQLKHNYLRFQEIADTIWERILTLDTIFNNKNEIRLKDMDAALLNGFFIQSQVTKLKVPPLTYAPPKTKLSPDWEPLTKRKLQLYQRFWDKKLKQSVFRSDNIWVEGKIRLSMLNTAKDLMGQLLEEVKQFKPYSPERLYYHHDFRVTLALRTVLQLSQILGVRSELKPVLSFPLGSNEITLDELALMYQTYVSGNITVRPESPSQNTWKLIDRIEDAKGNVIYQDKQIRKRVIPEETVRILQEILRSVVEYGTGRSSKSSLKMDIDIRDQMTSIRIPAYGKTGTANNYSNATYVGFLPTLQGGTVSMLGGYTIATYVGLDRQETESKPLPFKLTGASGGLPVWSEVARSIIHTPVYQNKLDWTLLPEMESGDVLPVPNPEGYLQELSLVTGLVIPKEDLSSQKSAIVYLPPVHTKASREVKFFKEIDELKKQTFELQKTEGESK